MNERIRQFATAPVGKLILAYSAPAIAGLLVYGLNRVVGNIFVGRFLGAEALAGFTVANTVVTIVLAFVVLVGAGATVTLSIKLGQKDLASAQRVLTNALTLSIVLAVPLGIVTWLLREPLLLCFGARGQALDQGKAFLGTFLWGTLFQFFTNVFNSSLRAVGRPMAALTTNLMSFLANTVLTGVFLVGFSWGMGGVGLANVVSQGLMALWTASFFLGSRATVRLERLSLRWDGPLVRSILNNGLSGFSLQMLMALLSILTNLVVVHYAGNQGMAVMGVVFSLYFLLVMPLQGTGTGIQPILGYNFGAGEKTRVTKTVRVALIFTTVVCCVELLLVALFRTSLVSLFLKNEPQIIGMAAENLLIVLAAFPVAGVTLVATSYFQAVGRVREAVGLTVFRSVFIAFPMVIFPLFWGFPGIFWSYPLTELVMATMSVFLYVSRKGPRESTSSQG